ncbi:class I SAM-dependent methyltransferase [Acuticoccus sp. MNP-M23]|uniref:class I SAM-dependent methyltransferase n=1 Tax=Acuticoccus sp. MNP-M23 TaxID=3072793 RepID=UPI0028166D8C|nr:class I SAM-dependent methyltransferase [Acuticoccus sp. MNP-M23]WMS44107.1 class I SAM-dependent methyltransferase [Acuticoccus sp. MNP-M23]
MSGFSADWLSLRAAADDRARSAELIAAAARHVGAGATIVDLGAGSGATLFALAPLLPKPLHFVLVDADPALLAEAERRFATRPVEGVSIETRAHDLVADPAPWDTPPALLTASALFDLASAPWIARLAAACGATGVPLLAMLTFDGVLEAGPAHPFDGPMRGAFIAHQQGEKTFGRAEGPDAPATLAAAFRAHGFAADEASTPWQLEAGRDDALMAATLDGWTEAASEILPAQPDAISAWRRARQDARTLTVGHRDQFFHKAP